MNLEQAIPIYDEKKLVYKRDENQGYITIIPKCHPEINEILINSTTVQIMQACTGSNNIADIVTMMHKRYPEVAKNIIAMDVINNLGNLEHLGIIAFNSTNPFNINKKMEKEMINNYTLKHITEDDLRDLYDFICRTNLFENSAKENRIINYINPFLNKNQYSEVVLRQKIFSFSEEFFVAMKMGNIVGCVSILFQPNPAEKQPAEIGIIVGEAEEQVEMLVEYAVETFLLLAVRNVTKIKYISLLPEDIVLEKILNQQSFIFEALLPDELGLKKDINIHARRLSEKEIGDIYVKRKEIGIEK